VPITLNQRIHYLRRTNSYGLLFQAGHAIIAQVRVTVSFGNSKRAFMPQSEGISKLTISKIVFVDGGVMRSARRLGIASLNHRTFFPRRRCFFAMIPAPIPFSAADRRIARAGERGVPYWSAIVLWAEP